MGVSATRPGIATSIKARCGPRDVMPGEVEQALPRDGESFASDLGGRHNPRYFGRRRGLTLYNYVNNRGEQYWVDVVNCTMREATYVLDGLLYQDAPEI